MAQIRWQYVTVLRAAHGDTTNNGISAKYDILNCFDGGSAEEVAEYVKKYGYDIDKSLYVVRRELWGNPAFYLSPLRWEIEKPGGCIMFGGNYAVGDSRWRDWFGHHLPLPIHDRRESQEEYETLSK